MRRIGFHELSEKNRVHAAVQFCLTIQISSNEGPSSPEDFVSEIPEVYQSRSQERRSVLGMR
jgi:hypothetical protein